MITEKSKQEVVQLAWLEDLSTWVTTRRTPRPAPKTLRAYLHDLAAFASWYEEAKRRPFTPPLLERDDYEAWREDRLQRGVRPNTINRQTAALRLLVDWVLETGQSDDDPLLRVQRLPLDANETRTAARWLEPIEALQMYRAIRVLPGWTEEKRALADALIRTVLEAGPRIEELASLSLEDAVLDPIPNAYIWVTASETRPGRKLRIGPDLVQSLQAWLAVRPSGTEWLFPGRGGVRISTRAVQSIMTEVSREAQIKEGVTCRDLRLTCGHRLYMSGWGGVALATFMGHFTRDGKPSIIGIIGYASDPRYHLAPQWIAKWLE